MDYNRAAAPFDLGSPPRPYRLEREREKDHFIPSSASLGISSAIHCDPHTAIGNVACLEDDDAPT